MNNMSNTKYYNLPNTSTSLVIGCAGSGKISCYIEPILKDLKDESCIVIDSRGTLYEKYKKSLLSRGYNVKLLDIDNSESDTYNPFDYLNTDYDCVQLAHSFIQSVSKIEDNFFKNTTESLLTALICYIHMKYAGTNRHNFSEVIKLCSMMHSDFNTVKDMFEELRKANSYCLAVKRFDDFIFTCEGKTLNNIIIDLAVKLSVFNIPNVINLLSTSDKNIELKGLLDTNTVVFLKISINDLTYDFIHNIFITQVLDMLNNNSPKKLRIILDDFQRLNLGFDNQILLQLCSIFDKYDNTDNLKTDIIIQSIAQLKQGAYRNLIIQRCKAVICLGVISEEDCTFFMELVHVDVKGLPLEKLLVVKRDKFKAFAEKYNKIHEI